MASLSSGASRHETSGSRDYSVLPNIRQSENHQQDASNVRRSENIFVDAYEPVRGSRKSSVSRYETQAVEPRPTASWNESPHARTPVSEVKAPLTRQVIVENPFMFFCNNCDREIDANEPRIQCNDCEDYDSCASCHLSGRMSGTHTFAHRFEIIQPGDIPTSRNVPTQPPIVPAKPGGKGKSIADQKVNTPTPPTSPLERLTLNQSMPPAKQAAFTKPPGTAEASQGETWTWLCAIIDGEKIVSKQGKNLFNAIFNYIDNLYEPFGAGQLNAEKIVHARTFWLAPDAKTWWIKRSRKTETGLRSSSSISMVSSSLHDDQFPIERFLERMDVSDSDNGYYDDTKRTTEPTYYDRDDPYGRERDDAYYRDYDRDDRYRRDDPYYRDDRYDRSSNVIVVRDRSKPAVKVTREGFYRFCGEHMFAFPELAWQETSAMLAAIPDKYKSTLPKGCPAKECFPEKDYETNRRMNDLIASFPDLSFLVYDTTANKPRREIAGQDKARANTSTAPRTPNPDEYAYHRSPNARLDDDSVYIVRETPTTRRERDTGRERSGQSNSRYTDRIYV
ncbi:hypothetical protein ABW21_db0200372 [Orbilia brochopaga]|nr:hypothetical protein ABW21_db0200372 [Drechslerella brochopaga]